MNVCVYQCSDDEVFVPLPKPFLDSLGWRPKDVIQVSTDGELVLLRKQPDASTTTETEVFRQRRKIQL